MPSHRSLLASASAAVAFSLSVPSLAWADEPIPVVATFSILGDMVERIGGERVAVTTLVGPDGDAHVYQLTPQAARVVAEADVLVMNGLEFEGWLERLSEAVAFDGALVVATKGVEPIAFDEHGDHDDQGDNHAEDKDHDHEDEHAEHGHDDHGDEHAEHGHDDHDEEHAEHDDHEDHGEDHAAHDDDHGHDQGAFDPHAWQSLANAVIYVDNITAGLAQADPDNAGAYYANLATYVAEIEALNVEVNTILDALPEDRRTVVTSHDAFQYFGRDYGLTFLAPQGLSTESEASAQDVSRLIEQMRDEDISAVFIENISDSRLLEQIANETGAAIGGTLHPGALSGPDGPASTYLKMIRHNATTLSIPWTHPARVGQLGGSRA